jgi:hypothetical protein
MAANPLGAHRVGIHRPTAWPADMRPAMMLLGVPGGDVIRISLSGTPSQKCSTENQAVAMQWYAAHRGIEIVHAYEIFRTLAIQK